MCVCLCVCVRACVRYLQQVGSDAPVRALLGHLFGQPGHLVRGLGDVLGALDQRPLVAAAPAHQAGHLGHEQGHALGGCDDVVALGYKREGTARERDRVNQRAGRGRHGDFSDAMLRF